MIKPTTTLYNKCTKYKKKINLKTLKKNQATFNEAHARYAGHRADRRSVCRRQTSHLAPGVRVVYVCRCDTHKLLYGMCSATVYPLHEIGGTQSSFRVGPMVRGRRSSGDVYLESVSGIHISYRRRRRRCIKQFKTRTRNETIYCREREPRPK